MRKTTLLAVGALLSTPGLTLAQNTPEENNPNVDAPFVRNIRADRPGQTITAQVLRPGRFQLEAGTQRLTPKLGEHLSTSGATLRVGFFNSMELRITQPYLNRYVQPQNEAGTSQIGAGWAPMVVGAKFMISPNYDTRTQVALLVESAMPGTGSKELAVKGLAPSGRLLVSQQLGQRYGLEANLGFSQPGLTVADISKGLFLGSLALNGAITAKTGFFVEAYGSGRGTLNSGTTAGLYWQPLPQIRLDVNAGRVLGGAASGTGLLGAGMVVKLGK
ncbi:transporter [Hymenobacter sp. IS2118]|uniref:transporter n=1 Tax=Hymenobacter sp. IS2118 TaxID=1505605 RepID=UPI001267C69C|nr:transporter [Hymenobacter sp. IS2118]